MTPLYIALIIFVSSGIYKFFILDAKYIDDKKTKEQKTKAKERSDKIYEAFITLITLFVTIYAIWLGEVHNA